MDNYIASNVNLLMRLTREAHEPNTELRKYKLYAKAKSEVLNTIEQYHGLYYLHYIAYITFLRLGHALGPINQDIMIKLIKHGCIVTKVIYI